MTVSEASQFNGWNNPAAFQKYEGARRLVGPALTLVYQDMFAEHVRSEGAVLEIGAGGGALTRYLDGAAQNYEWLESDQNPAFLALDRRKPVEQAVVQLPEIPFEDETFDAITGLGVLDTLNLDDLAESAREIRRVLKTGGVLLHFMDLAPDPALEIEHAKAEQRVPVVVVANKESREIGLGYIDMSDPASVLRKIEELPVADPVKRVFMTMVLEPMLALEQLTATTGLEFMGDVALQSGLITDIHSNWFKKITNQITDAATAAGLELIYDDQVERSAYVTDRVLPAQYSDSTSVTRTGGSIGFRSDSGSLIVPGKVKATAGVHVLVAEKVA